ncbi:PilZ domain-containing protein [Methanococcoides sp. SA1]|uniref:PilZ domain-containing protein n=1 Tax=Candidatus Desulfatifera sulfidica TaxID=2841691 RepID=A0A8J6TEJ8_9BACT|nr:PilZ domain-containing protein [Candidatus Desulfatifera sulfidica]NPE29470.1 PilZ domain-containing protein [Methanococcoides sp. SA1]
MKVPEHDRRNRYRAPMGTTVSWSTDRSLWYVDSARDVSTMGILLMDRRPITLGSIVTLMFNLPNSGERPPVVTESTVVRVVSRYGRLRGHGLCFDLLTEYDYEIIQNYVFRILGLSKDQVTGAGLAGNICRKFEH